MQFQLTNGERQKKGNC